MAYLTTIRIDAPVEAEPYSTVQVTATVTIGAMSYTSPIQAVRLRLYYELFPNDPVHFPPRKILDTIVQLWPQGPGANSASRSASFEMPPAGEIGTSVQATTDVEDENGVWRPDNYAQDVIDLDIEEPSPPSPPPSNGEVPECLEGDSYCDGDDLMYCENGQWKREHNAAECKETPPPPVCSEGDHWCEGTTLVYCRNGELHRERKSPQCGYEPPDGGNDEEPPAPFPEGNNTLTYVAAGAAVFGVAMLALSHRKGQ